MEITEIMAQLSKEWDLSEIKYRPGASIMSSPDDIRVSALAYIDARMVMERLDEVVPGNWSFSWEVVPTPDNSVVVKGRLTVLGRVAEDVGQAAHEEEAWKAAVSDALKRCAVHFGIGRFLYFLPRVWVKGKRVGKSITFADVNDVYRTMLKAVKQKKKPAEIQGDHEVVQHPVDASSVDIPAPTVSVPKPQSHKPQITCEVCRKPLNGMIVGKQVFGAMQWKKVCDEHFGRVLCAMHANEVLKTEGKPANVKEIGSAQVNMEMEK